jgi:hypothetical protein
MIIVTVEDTTMTTPASKNHISVRKNNKTGGPFFSAKTKIEEEADKKSELERSEQWMHTTPEGRILLEAREYHKTQKK